MTTRTWAYKKHAEGISFHVIVGANFVPAKCNERAKLRVPCSLPKAQCHERVSSETPVPSPGLLSISNTRLNPVEFISTGFFYVWNLRQQSIMSGWALRSLSHLYIFVLSKMLSTLTPTCVSFLLFKPIVELPVWWRVESSNWLGFRW